jgi:hypothetical protein
MQGAQRNASVLRREAMRRHLVTSKSRAEAYERVLPASVVRFGCGRPMADRNRARVALCDSNQPSRHQALLAVPNGRSVRSMLHVA